MASPPPPPAAPATALVRQAREQLAQALTQALPELAARMEAFLEHLADQVGTQREMQAHRAALERYRAHQTAWVQACHDALQIAQVRLDVTAPDSAIAVLAINTSCPAVECEHVCEVSFGELPRYLTSGPCRRVGEYSYPVLRHELKSQ